MSSLVATSSRSPRREILIATTGIACQVTTLTIDELVFERGVPLSHVVLVHTSAAGAMSAPLDKLRHEIETFYASRCPDLSFEFVCIEDKTGYRPLDTLEARDVNAVMSTLYAQIVRWKKEGATVHLSISGGRKIMSALALVAAQLGFDSQDDKCWHLLSEELLTHRGLMHAEAQHTVTLVPVPVLLWETFKEYPSRSLAEAIAQDPLHAQEIMAKMSEDKALKLRDEFVDTLPKEKAEILRALALHGWENEEIDARLHVNCKNDFTKIWEKYGAFCLQKGLSSELCNIRLQRGRLIADFHMVFQARERRRNA